MDYTKLQKYDYVGGSVGIDDSGKIYVVGAPGINLGYLRKFDEETSESDVTNGCVYVYYGNETQKIVSPEVVTGHDRFGTCVRISNDGQRIAIGSYNAEAVYVYKFNSLKYELEYKVSPGKNCKSFGYNLWLNHDGSEMIVGAHDSLSYVGSVYHFKDGKQTHKFYPVELENDIEHFGRSVWLSKDGLTAMIGCTNNSSVYEFYYNEDTWVQTDRIRVDGIKFGNSISRENDDFLIGAFGSDFAMLNDVKIQGNPGTAFGGSVKLRHGYCVVGSFRAEDSWFGYSVDIFPNGNILVGSPMKDCIGRFDILTQKQAKERGLFVAPIKNLK